MGFNCQPVDELAEYPIQHILQRMNAVMPAHTPAVVVEAVLGAEPRPKVKVSGAFKIYCEEIVAGELAGKSPAQRERWKNVKKRAINSFINVVGDKPIVNITRDDGRAFYKFWLAKLVNKSAKDPDPHPCAIVWSEICGCFMTRTSLIVKTRLPAR
ncbi:hypothetical protein [Pseudorhodoplanes sinuspersici]|uniref:Uncharacterized protein n=1 Tax=Pseudorhodoplanes sinuspersici TaxID=1235591 RepID=A0A1W6ZVK1_9HYPH|nr:hypothetical protein [Pseudorhodoplanes sinuspersici]ARQ01298.1 hypothetical protein CAK95_21015 [Pseudorhodoplanes sinuspersici]